jgi:hypothetical protein
MSMGESTIRKRYDDLRGKGITILDISPDIISRRFVNSLLKGNNMPFNHFFNRCVIERNRKILHDDLLVGLCQRDIDEYRLAYAALLSSADDRRTLNAMAREMSLLGKCHDRGRVRIPFLSISSKRRVSEANDDTPIRVFMHAADKLDLRAGSAFYELPLLRYIGRLVTDGMFDLFMRCHTSSEERALMNGDTEDGTDDCLIDEAMTVLHGRLTGEYVSTLGSIRDDRFRCNFDGLSGWNRQRDMESIAGITVDRRLRLDIIDLPDVSKKNGSVTGNDFARKISERDIVDIINDNMNRPAEPTPTDPETNGILAGFRSVAFRKNATRQTRTAEAWNRLRTVMRTHIETLILINGDDPCDTDIDGLSDDICRNVRDDLVRSGVADSGLLPVFDIDDELLTKIRCAIDDSTNDGGLTKSQLRIEIGRNHSRYIDIVNEMLAYLVETGKYSVMNGRYVSVSESSYTKTMLSRPAKGRPRRNTDDDNEIIQRIEGRLSDYIPAVPKKKTKE